MDGPGFEGVAAADAERGEVGADGAQGGIGVFDEDGFACATAESLDSDGSGTGVEIEKDRAGDARGEHIEEGFAQAVAGWARVKAFGGDERARAKLAGDDAHRFMVTRVKNAATHYNNVITEGR